MIPRSGLDDGDDRYSDMSGDSMLNESSDSSLSYRGGPLPESSSFHLFTRKVKFFFSVIHSEYTSTLSVCVVRNAVV